MSELTPHLQRLQQIVRERIDCYKCGVPRKKIPMTSFWECPNCKAVETKDYVNYSSDRLKPRVIEGRMEWKINGKLQTNIEPLKGLHNDMFIFADRSTRWTRNRAAILWTLLILFICFAQVYLRGFNQ